VVELQADDPAARTVQQPKARQLDE